MILWIEKKHALFMTDRGIDEISRFIKIVRKIDWRLKTCHCYNIIIIQNRLPFFISLANRYQDRIWGNYFIIIPKTVLQNRQSTVEPLALNVVYKKLGAGSNVLLKLHGICMIAAWMGCVGTGIIFARYFKTTWKVKNLLCLNGLGTCNNF